MNNLQETARGGVNILVNGDFKNPINQRGQSSYTTPGYGPDGWQISGDWVSLTLTDDGFLCTTGQDGGPLRQHLDGADYLKGRDVTLSCEINGKIYAFTGTVPSGPFQDAQPVIAVDIGGVVAQLYTVNNGSWSGLFCGLILIGSQEITVGYMHLAEGRTHTLPPHTDSGAELRRCQRTFYRLWGGPGAALLCATVSALGSWYWTDLIMLPAAMRSAPAAAASDGVYFGHINGSVVAYNGTTYNQVRVNRANDRIVLAGEYSPGFYDGSPLFLNIPEGEYIDFSAEI
jgi:hypothetical protein